MINHKKISLSLLVALLATANLWAQDPNDLPGGEVEVVKQFEAQLAESERVEVKPELPSLDTSIQRQRYNLPTRALDMEYAAPTIKPLAMRREKVPPAYKGFAKLGAGFPRAYYGAFGFADKIGKQFDIGLGGEYHSMNNTKNVENQAFRDISTFLDGTYYFDQGFAVNGKLGYTQNQNHFYGYNFDENIELPDTILMQDVEQKFNIFDFHAEIFNGEETVGDFNYSGAIDFYAMGDNYATRENGVDLTLRGTKYFNAQHPLDVVLRTDFTNYEDTIEQKLHNFHLEPSFTYVGNSWKIRGGVNMVVHDDNYDFFPDAELLVNLLGPRLSFFVGADGNLQKNTFRRLTEYNPFLKSRIELSNSNYREYYGGLKGAVSFLEYNGRVSYKQVDDLVLYVAEFDEIVDYQQRFAPVLDSVNILGIGGSVLIRPLKDLEVRATINQNIYEVEREAEAWHLPAFEFGGNVTYKALDSKLLLRGDIFIENGVPYQTDAGQIETLNGLFDVSLGGEYYFTKNIGVFVQLNNLANNKRQRWVNYPTYGINGLFGVSARF